MTAVTAVTAVKVVGIGGSLSPRSSSLRALATALGGAEAAGAETEVLDVRELDLPFFETRTEEKPPDAVRLCDAVHAADGLIWSSPLYHGTVSGSFKNVLDWLELLADRDPPYLTNKVVALIAAAGGGHGLQAVNTMEFVVRALRGWAVPLVVPIAQAFRAFDEEGRPLDARLDRQLRGLGAEVVRAAGRLAAA